jgi:hypothetical protein
MGMLTHGDEKRLGPATPLYETVTVSFVIPSEAEGSAVPRTSPGSDEFRPPTKLSSRLPRRAGVAQWIDLRFFLPKTTAVAYIQIPLPPQPQYPVPVHLRKDALRSGPQWVSLRESGPPAQPPPVRPAG